MILIALILSYATCQYVTTIAGNNLQSSIDGQGIAASFNSPWGLTMGLNGNLFITDRHNHQIRKLNATGYVTTFAGSGYNGFSDGPGRLASFNLPTGIHSDSVGNLYVADTHNQRIRMISPTGHVTTIAGNGNTGNTDGQSATLYDPTGIWVDSSSNIYIVDVSNHMIRMINSTGYVTTIAGNGSPSFLNGQGHNATFNYPDGISVDMVGNIYVCDSANNVIRMINSTGFVSTFAGNGEQGSSDGDALSASFNKLRELSFDYMGNLLVADYGNNIIRTVNTTGYVTTIAGSGIQGFSDGFASSAEFYWPVGIVGDSNGNIFVADMFNNRIRKIDMHYTSTTMTPTLSATSAMASSSMISSAIPASPSASSFTPTTSSTNYQQGVKNPSIYVKPEFTYSFMVGFMAILLVLLLFNFISIRSKRRTLTTKRRLMMQHEKEMQMKMAELRKRTLSKSQRK